MTSPAPTANRPSNPPAANVKAAEKVPGKRGRQPGTEVTTRVIEFAPDEMQFHQLTDKVKADRRRKREPRGPFQQKVDAIVYEIFEINEENGYDRATIADWADLEVFDWAVTKNKAEDALFAIRKACDLYNRRPILGEQVEIDEKSHTIPNPAEEGDEFIPCHLNGKPHVHIPFSVVRKRPPRRG